MINRQSLLKKSKRGNLMQKAFATALYGAFSHSVYTAFVIVSHCMGRLLQLLTGVVGEKNL